MSVDNKIKNVGITEIVMDVDGARSFCPLGGAPYTHNFYVIVEPGEFVPDYLSIEEWVKGNFSEDKQHTIEDAITQLADYLYKTFDLKKVKVTDVVYDAKHFPVEVTTERSKQRCN